MANIRVKDLPNTNTAADTDEFIIDSSTAGTRRLSYSELKSEISTDFAADVATYGIATLDSDNKLTASQIPDSLAQGMNFVGVANSAGDLTSTTQGDFYVIQTAFGSYNVGDQAVYDGSAYVRVVDGTKEISEGGTGATTLDDAKTNLEIIDVGTGPSQVPLNQHLGTMAYQDIAGVSMARAEVETLEVTDKVTGPLTVSNTSAATSFILANSGGGTTLNFAVTENTGGIIDASEGASARNILFKTGGTERWRINSSGNLVANGTAIDFGSGATFDNYEHGDITSVTDASGAGLAITADLKYQVIGKSVQISGKIIFPVTADTNAAQVTLLPEQCPNDDGARGLSVSYSTIGSAFYVLPLGGTNDVMFYTVSGSTMSNNALSGVAVFISGNYSIN